VGRRTSIRVSCAAVLAALVAALLGGSAAAVSFFISANGSPATVTISTAGDKATATFSGTKNQRVSLDITNSTIASMKISLLKPDGTALFTVSATKTAKFVDTNTLPVNGTYKLVVNPNLDYTGKVTLKLYTVPPDASASATFGGAPGTVTTTVPGQDAYVTFNGLSGHRAAVSLTGVTVSSGSVTVLDPGAGVFAPTRAFAKAGIFIDPLDLPQDGPYTVVLNPKSKAIGSVTVTAYDVPADTSAPLTLGSPATGTISVPGQRARFTFSGTAGQRVSLNVESSAFNGAISLLRQDGSSVSSTVMSPSGGFLDPVVLPATETYTVLLDPSGAQTGAAQFVAYDVPADQIQAITAGGPAVGVTTTVPGQNAWLTFAATAGQRITILVENVLDLNPAELDLQKESGTHVIPAPLTVTSSGAWPQTLTLAAGNYKILLDPQQYHTGTADVRLFTVPPDLGGSIPLNTLYPVTTTAPGQNATYTFTGVVNTRLSLNLTGVTIQDLKVSILKPDGTNLIVKRVGTSGGFAEPVKLTVGGTYTVKVDPQSLYYGSVTVGIYVVPANTTGTLTLGTPLTITTAVPGQNATRTFSISSAPQRLSLRFTGVTMASVKVIVKAPKGSTPLQYTYPADGGDFVDPVTLPDAGGPYTVTIDPQGASTGSVTLTFYNVPADAPGTTSCTTTVPGQNCKLTFTQSSGTHVTATTNVPTDPGQTQSVWLTVYQGTVLDFGHQIGFGTTGPLVPNTFDVAPAFSGGTYTIVVDPFGAATGTTSVAIS
jgi:hypothetical protein